MSKSNWLLALGVVCPPALVGLAWAAGKDVKTADVASPLVISALAVVGITAVVVALVYKLLRALTGTAAVVFGSLFVPILWVLWGLTFLYTGTPSSDHDETMVYIGVSVITAVVSLPLSFVTSYVAVRLLNQTR